MLVCSDKTFSGTVYVRGSLRGLSGGEYYLLPGEYSLENDSGALLVQNFSENLLSLSKETLITRAFTTDKSL